MSRSARVGCSQPSSTAAETWTEEQLVARLVESQPLAWREFQRRYDRLIHRCIPRSRAASRRSSAQDDVREIYATLCLSLLANDMHKLRTFDPERGNRFSSWIGLLAINCAYDYLRSMRREPQQGGAHRGERARVRPARSVRDRPCERERARDRRRSCSQSFSDKDRAFAALYFGEGLDPNEIAARMNISVKTVYSKKHKIQARLESMQRAALTVSMEAS